MSTELWIGEDFEHGHEMEALAIFLKNLQRQYSTDPTRFCVLANFMVNYSPIDLAVVKNNGIAVIELKYVTGPVFGAENGDWLIRDGIQEKVLRGGSKGNPYKQVISYRIAFLKFLSAHRSKFLQARAGLEPRLDHVKGIVALCPSYPKGSDLSLPDERWLKVTGLDDLHREVFQTRSAQLILQPKEITRLLENVLGLKREDINKYVETVPKPEEKSLQPENQPICSPVPVREPIKVLEGPTIHHAADAEPRTSSQEACLVCALGLPQCASKRLSGKVEGIASSEDFQYVLRITDDDFEMVSIPVHESWNDYVGRLKSWLDVNESVPVTILHLEKCGETLWLGENSLLVIEPDWLINVTDMTNVEFCPRQLLLDRFVSSPTNEHMIRGTLVHLLFPDIWHLKGKEQIAKRRLELLRERVEDFIATKSSPDAIDEKCDHAIEHIFQWIAQRKRSTRLRTETFVLSPSLGMKGKIDFLWEEPSTERIVGVGELKTGKSQGAEPKPGHALQLLSYAMMLLARGEITFDTVYATLLYSGNDMLGNNGGNLHRRLVPVFAAIKDAVNIRNDLVLMELTGRSRFETNMNKCSNCRSYKTHCARIALLGNEKDTRPIESKKWLPSETPAPSEKQKVFFQHYASLISQELRALKGIHANLWRKTPLQREEEGITFRAESCSAATPLKGGYRYQLNGANTTDFRAGDAVLISDERGPSMGRVSLGVVQSTSKDGLLIGSNEEIRFKPVWVDPYTSEGLTIRLFKGLYRFVSNPSHLHDLIFDGKSPEFGSLPIEDKSLVKILDKERLNEFQKNALQSAICTKSYCIVHGPPGSGKTKLIQAIVKAHLLINQRVLICTGTNRALDEAMKSLAAGELRNQALRIGDPGSVTDNNVRSLTLRHLIQDIEPLDLKISKGIDALSKRSVVGITASSLQSGRYDKALGTFDLVVIDEAAQLTVPATVGCISFAKRFVLIGDHRQLPAVVQSDCIFQAETDCSEKPWSRLSKSLFEILYERAVKNSGREVVLLKDQYRMNDHICSIPAALYYRGALRPGTPKVSDARLAIDVRELKGFERKVLDPQESVKFIHVPLDSRGGFRTNLTEARVVSHIVKALIEAKFSLEREDALGIVCPRRAQVELIRRQLEILLKEMDLVQTGECKLILDSVSTVDRFQGSQRDVIIVSLGMTDGIVSQHLADERRLNVAMSRARHKLIILGNRPALSDDAVFSRLFETMERELAYPEWYVETDLKR